MGEPIDGLGEIVTDEMSPIHKDAAKLNVDMDTFSGGKAEVFETGIKAIDLLFPVVKGSKTGMLGGAACGKSVIILELINNVVERHSVV